MGFSEYVPGCLNPGLTGPFLHLGNSQLGRSPTLNLQELLWQNFYTSINKIKALKYDRLTVFTTDNMLPSRAKNTVMVVRASRTRPFCDNNSVHDWASMPRDTMLPSCAKNTVTDVRAALTSSFKEVSLLDNNSVYDLQTTFCHHSVMVSQKYCSGRTFYQPDALPVTEPSVSKH